MGCGETDKNLLIITLAEEDLFNQIYICVRCNLKSLQSGGSFVKISEDENSLI